MILGSASPQKSGMPKKLRSWKVWTVAPALVKMRPMTLIISKTWLGPAATWGSGGWRGKGLFVSSRPEKLVTVDGALGCGPAAGPSGRPAGGGRMSEAVEGGRRGAWGGGPAGAPL